jgi:hypothetical protein
VRTAKMGTAFELEKPGGARLCWNSSGSRQTSALDGDGRTARALAPPAGQRDEVAFLPAGILGSG